MAKSELALAVKVLGPLTVESGRSELPISRPQSRTILALLALAEGGWVSQDVLAEALWRDSLPKSPRASLQVAIARLRTTLGPGGDEVIRSGTNGYLLDRHRCDIDLYSWGSAVDLAQHCLEQGNQLRALQVLDSARQLWRGRLLQGLELPTACDQQAAQIERRRVDAELDLGRLLLEANQARAATRIVDELLADNPLREDIVSLGVHALSTNGRTVEAVKLAVAFRSRLISELGLEPSEHFARIERQALNGDLMGQRDSDRPPLMRPAFVASIVDEILVTLESEQATVLSLEGPLEFSWVTLLDQLQAEIASAEIEVIRLDRRGPLPHSLRRISAGSATGGGTATGQWAEHLTAMEAWRQLAAEQPTAVLVEEGEHLDTWSQELVEIAASGGEAIAGLAIVIAVVQRSPNESSPVLSSASLPPVDDASVRSATAWHRPGEPAHHLDAHSAAISRQFNRAPLWIEHELQAGPTEAMRHIVSNGGAALAPLSQLLDGLEPSTFEAVGLGAILGLEIDCAVAAAVLGEQVHTTLRRFAPAVSRGILVAHRRSEHLVFSDEEARAAALQTVGYDQAKVWHRRAGDWLQVNERAIEAAHHKLEALPLGSADDVSDSMAQAGHELMLTGSYREAIECFRHGLRLANDDRRRARRMLDCATALELVGEHDEADELLDDALGRVFAADDVDTIAHLALAGAGRAGKIGGLANRRRRLALALSRVPDNHPLADQMQVELALELVTSRRDLEPDHLQRIAKVAAGPVSPASLTAQRLLLVVDQIRTGAPFADARALVDQLQSQPALQPRDEAACWAAAAHVALECGEWPAAEAWLGELRLLGDRSGNPRAAWQSRVMVAALSEARGEAGLADQQASEALRLGRRLGLDDAEATYGMYLLGRAYLAADLGPYRESLVDTSGAYNFPLQRSLLALAALDQGDHAAAAESLKDILDDLDDSVEVFRLATLATTALVTHRLGSGKVDPRLRSALDDRAGRHVFVGYGGPYLGPVDWYRSLLAHDADETAQRAQHAEATCRAVRARAWLASRLRRTI